jgi:hypothetical protein
MPDPVRFPFVAAGDAATILMPRMPLRLSFENRSVDVLGLLDTGAAVSVLPYSIGLALGAVWDQQTTVVPLVGSLGQGEARALLVDASQPQLTPDAPVRLVFAWTRTEDVPAILGQVNFFLEFDVCFFRARGVFEVSRRQAPSIE